MAKSTRYQDEVRKQLTQAANGARPEFYSSLTLGVKRYKWLGRHGQTRQQAAQSVRSWRIHFEALRAVYTFEVSEAGGMHSALNVVMPPCKEINAPPERVLVSPDVVKMLELCVLHTGIRGALLHLPKLYDALLDAGWEDEVLWELCKENHPGAWYRLFGPKEARRVRTKITQGLGKKEE
jgi:hypothetical protein